MFEYFRQGGVVENLASYRDLQNRHLRRVHKVYTRRMDIRWGSGTAAFIISAAMLAGCQGSPFQDEPRPRTPYARYQDLRGEERPKTYTDSFGQERPALRQRLAPLDGL
jgi:hypothetical protein